MTRSSELLVFRDGKVVGAFRRDDDGHVDFEYADGVEDCISLSLPLDGEQDNSAKALNFLDNLLPDNPRVRLSWARTLGVPNTPFDLVRELGEDVAGALVLLPAGERPSARAASLTPISRDEIAARIARITRDPDAWSSAERLGQERMSLAGAQGKFALARVDGSWFLPSASVPSTHILKPPAERFVEAAELEAGSLSLAGAVGIEVPDARVVDVLGQHSYIVERFDRDVPDQGVARRVHAEDMAQALGLPPGSKYDVTAVNVIRLLAEHAPEEDVYGFIRMLAFNTAIGNADAHAKNYTLMLRPERKPRLAPLYDALPTGVWPNVETKLAMGIGQAETSEDVIPYYWRELARTARIDPDRAQEVAVATYQIVAERAHDVYQGAGVSPKMLARVDKLIARTTKAMVRSETDGPQLA